MKSDYGIDKNRVYVMAPPTGGAMASVTLATYPDVFAGGAIMSGIPYGCARGLRPTF